MNIELPVLEEDKFDNLLSMFGSNPITIKKRLPLDIIRLIYRFIDVTSFDDFIEGERQSAIYEKYFVFNELYQSMDLFTRSEINKHFYSIDLLNMSWYKDEAITQYIHNHIVYEPPLRIVIRKPHRQPYSVLCKIFKNCKVYPNLRKVVICGKLRLQTVRTESIFS